MAGLAYRAVIGAQDKLLGLLGNTADGRAAIVAKMLRRDASEATSYWLQLVVSVGIATLGLVVGSAAVVIGAMLVAPLMGPIIGLAMGLASGSPFLVLRTSGRIAASVVVVVGGAALITLLLPFHELNPEIIARTSPTVLDLITAAFCALAGVYAAIRSGSDTATTAAGTSIGISLVPPLCASGYGFGTAAWHVAGGAALLFLTNLAAIVFVGTLAFVAAGFNRVDVLALEHAELDSDASGAPVARALARRLSSVFESRWGPVMRFLMPFVLLATIYVPLRRALDEVAWQVRVRATVTAAIAREPLRVVQSRVRVERRSVDVVLVVLGKTTEAEASKTRMEAEIRQAAGVAPRIEVHAVPDATAIAGLESSLLNPRRLEPPSSARSPIEQLDTARAHVRKTLSDLWPHAASGAPLVVDIDTTADGPLQIRVVHIGAPASNDALETLRRAVGAALARDVVVVDVAVPVAPLTRGASDLRFVGLVSAAIEETRDVPSINVCVVRPPTPPRGRRPTGADTALANAMDGILATHPRVARMGGDDWSVRFVDGPCAPRAAPSDAGAPNGPALP
ncbi:MAG: DUF389 domain-containing protein [Polyangiaceae bacterium]